MNKKILLITGASSDIGMALMKKVVNQYEVVLAHYCHLNDQLENMKKEYGKKIELLQADFGCETSVQDMLQKINDRGVYPNHIVHLAAPSFKYLQFRKTSWEDYEYSAQISVKPIINILHEYLPQMAKEKYGKVVFMLSACVLGTSPKFMSPYVTTKYELLGLMKSLSIEYIDKGITVNGVSPEMVDTKYLSGVPDVLVQQNAEAMPLGRLLNIYEVVPTIEYLLSDGADMVNGQNIGITGGH